MSDNNVVSIVPRLTPELSPDKAYEAVVRTYYAKNQRDFFHKKVSNQPLLYYMYQLERLEPGILGVHEVISLAETMDKSYRSSLIFSGIDGRKEFDVTTLKECVIVLSHPELPGRSFQTGYDKADREFIALAMPEFYEKELKPFEGNEPPRYTINLVAQLIAAINKVGQKNFKSLNDLIHAIVNNPQSLNQKTINLLIFFCTYSKQCEEGHEEISKELMSEQEEVG